jgi:uncharacterized protein YfkK (UPF0435 family)
LYIESKCRLIPLVCDMYNNVRKKENLSCSDLVCVCGECIRLVQ